MSVLARIMEEKRVEVEAARARVSEADLLAAIADQEPPLGFRAALLNSPNEVALIAEVKKASPSQGLIRPDFDPAQVARAYRNAGAEALSVLTDVPNFQGHPDNLAIARRESGLPCLRKDFLRDPYQVLEARAWGADAVLLIVAALAFEDLVRLNDKARELGMDVLVEVHSPAEAEIAGRLGADLIGVNNRDLSNFRTDLAMSEQILPTLGAEVVKVSESALETRADIDRVHAAGARAVLIGTSFCAAPDIEAKVHEVMGR